ncbi:MAG: homocysteine S-methyltransferase family protein [Candidatus Coatesbacteria bacterium]
MRTSLAERLKRGIVLLDGAMGTELIRAGLPNGKVPEAWLLERPDAIGAVHAAYLAAGSDLVYTCTFGGTSIKLRRLGLEAQAGEINRLGARAARAAAGEDRWVLGDIGPTGELLDPMGDLEEIVAQAAFAAQAKALLEGGADGIVVETMTDLNEAAAAVRGAKEAGARFIIATMSFEGASKSFRTMMGTTPEQAVTALAEAGATAVGANCGGDPPALATVIARMRAVAPGLPLVAKPNAGMPVHEAGGDVHPVGPDQFAALVKTMIDAGATIVGGCCGSSPAHLAALRAILPS